MHGRDRGVDYEACAGKGVFEIAPDFDGVETRLEGFKLMVEGVGVGAVQFVSDQPSEALMRSGPTNAYLLDFERRHHGHYVTGIPCATAYFGTLMMDEGGGHNGWKNSIIMRWLSRSTSQNSTQVKELWRLLKEAFSQSIQEAISRSEEEVLAVTSEWLRTLNEQGVPRAGRLFEFDGGYIGLALQDVGIGDIVCVLNGSQYPIILRPLPDDLFEFVGMCFVLGLMKGEARAFFEHRETCI